jgi:hypothetical protein
MAVTKKESVGLRISAFEALAKPTPQITDPTPKTDERTAIYYSCGERNLRDS